MREMVGEVRGLVEDWGFDWDEGLGCDWLRASLRGATIKEPEIGVAAQIILICLGTLLLPAVDCHAGVGRSPSVTNRASVGSLTP